MARSDRVLFESLVSISFYVDPDTDQEAVIVVNEGLVDQTVSRVFSKNQAHSLLRACLQEGLLSQDQNDRISREVLASNLPDSRGSLVFVECIRCKGHGWLVTDLYNSMDVRNKAAARSLLDSAPGDLNLTKDVKDKVLSDINASSMPEDATADLEAMFRDMMSGGNIES